MPLSYCAVNLNLTLSKERLMTDTATQAAQDDNPEISATKDVTDSIF